MEDDVRLKLENGDALYFLGEKRLLTVIRENRKRGKAKMVMERILLWVSYEADYEEKEVSWKNGIGRKLPLFFRKKRLFMQAFCLLPTKKFILRIRKAAGEGCSSLGNMNFNWRIIMAPESVCDYVVIHELCHLKHMDHSERFWGVVGSICPGYKQYRKWLKDHGKELYPF